MATHLREQITLAVVAAVTGLATTGAHVYRGRGRVLQDNELPGLVVTAMGESPTFDGNSDVLQRPMRVSITAHVKASSGYDTTLNQILKEVEVALNTPTLGGAKDVVPLDIGDPDISEEGEKPVARQEFTFEAWYCTRAGVPDVAL